MSNVWDQVDETVEANSDVNFIRYQVVEDHIFMGVFVGTLESKAKNLYARLTKVVEKKADGTVVRYNEPLALSLTSTWFERTETGFTKTLRFQEGDAILVKVQDKVPLKSNPSRNFRRLVVQKIDHSMHAEARKSAQVGTLDAKLTATRSDEPDDLPPPPAQENFTREDVPF